MDGDGPRFGAMIATSTVVMFGLMYLNAYALDHLSGAAADRAVHVAMMAGAVAMRTDILAGPGRAWGRLVARICRFVAHGDETRSRRPGSSPV